MDEVSPDCEILFVVVFPRVRTGTHGNILLYIILYQIIIYHYHNIRYITCVLYTCIYYIMYDIHTLDNGIRILRCILFTDRVCIYTHTHTHVYINCILYMYRREKFTARRLYIWRIILHLRIYYNNVMYLQLLWRSVGGQCFETRCYSSIDGKQKLFL